MPSHDYDDIHDQGLQFDLATLMNRRRALKLFGGAAAGATALVVVGCSDSDSTPGAAGTADSSPGASGTAAANAGAVGGGATTAAAATPAATAVISAIPSTATTPASACVPEIPAETAGPYPGDGSNGPNVLAQSGIIRSDLRSSFGTSTKTASGVPLSFELTIVDTAKNCAPLAGAAVYAWHCDRAGLYSMYSAGATNENYLRGIQSADANGRVRFVSIFPGAYLGRWPHVHFEVYPSLDKATSSANKLATSQFALPDETCKAVYATSGYEQSGANHARTTLQSDNVFRDGWALQMANVTGSANAGYTARLTVGV